MFNFLIKKFVKNSEDVTNPKVRESYGKLSGVLGIILNIILSFGKMIIGFITGAVSIVSDGVNNLSDASSSVITLIGFKLSSKKPDKKHPYGYGRVEYFAGLAISTIIIFVAISLLKESITKIIAGETLNITLGATFYVTVAILVASIFIKFLMAMFNVKVGKKIKSVALTATFLDCITDCISTFVVLSCTVLSLFINSFPLDGVAGIVVSLFIAYTGVRSILEVVSPLLGEAPDAEVVKEIRDYAVGYDKNVVGLHDMMFHDYGPGRKLVIMHVEVPAEGDIMELHDMIDNLEKDIEKRYNCMCTIHMDPVVTTSARLNAIKDVCRKIVKEINPSFDIHDFRMNEGSTHANVIFDLALDRETKISFFEIEEKVTKKIKEYDDKLNVVINVEYNLV